MIVVRMLLNSWATLEARAPTLLSRWAWSSCWRRTSVSSRGPASISGPVMGSSPGRGRSVGESADGKWYRPRRSGVFIRTARGRRPGKRRRFGPARLKGAAGSVPRGRGSASSDSWAFRTSSGTYPIRTARHARPDPVTSLIEAFAIRPRRGQSAALYPSTTLSRITRITIPWATMAMRFSLVFLGDPVPHRQHSVADLVERLHARRGVSGFPGDPPCQRVRPHPKLTLHRRPLHVPDLALVQAAARSGPAARSPARWPRPSCGPGACWTRRGRRA